MSLTSSATASARRIPQPYKTLDATELEAVRQRARQIATQLGQPSVYDATYAAFAEARGWLFWTADQRFANAAK